VVSFLQVYPPRPCKNFYLSHTQNIPFTPNLLDLTTLIGEELISVILTALQHNFFLSYKLFYLFVFGLWQVFIMTVTL